MKKLTTTEIRQLWIDFFQEKGHQLHEPKSLVPYNDKSLLFINSGVATLKSFLDGTITPSNPRIVNSQKSLRTNDIENVGLTSRHHTLFEMLGNFSIGDYFKKEVITYALEFLCSEKYLEIDLNKLYFTYHPEDLETKEFWLKAGVQQDHLVACSENYWEIGKGPGGPNTEVFFDRGSELDERNPEYLLGDDVENDRLIEIWGIVFSQYNCEPETKKRFEYSELPNKNIDTGMGLERIAMLSQNVESTFETDNFQAIIQNIEFITGLEYIDFKKAMRIQADHIRAVTFAIADGVVPSSEGRGYIVRRLIRRSLKYGVTDLKIGPKPYLYKLVNIVVRTFSDYYPYLKELQPNIEKVIKQEEIKFLSTLSDALKILDKYIISGSITGRDAFMIYDTHGMPVEITKEIVEQHNLSFSMEEYENSLLEQQTRARINMSKSSSMSLQSEVLSKVDESSKFIGYETLTVNSEVLQIIINDHFVDRADNIEALLVLKETPFYATSGGQIADLGLIDGMNVIDVQKTATGVHIHKILVTKEIAVGQHVKAEVDYKMRNIISQNHSVTHLLHLSLQKYLGEDTKQAGSLQDYEKTRFDFTTFSNVTEEKICEIEKFVNEEIRKNSAVEISMMPLEKAKISGVTALFEEKYGDIVRVVKMNKSLELCAGTHVKNTGEIEKFHIVSSFGIGSGIKRIEAITGNRVYEYEENFLEQFNEEKQRLENELQENKIIKLNELNNILEKFQRLENVLEKKYDDLHKIVSDLKNKNLENLKNQENKTNSELSTIAQKILENLETKDEIIFLDQTIENLEMKELRILGDNIFSQLKNCVILIISIKDDKVAGICKVSDNLKEQYQANKILNEKLQKYQAKGGGNSVNAQGGGTIH